MVDRSGYSGVISTAPFGYRKNDGYVVAFRYGAVVMIGLGDADENSVLDELKPEKVNPPEEERFSIEIRPDQDEGLATNGGLQLKELTAAHVLVLADVLAKSVALASYEREIASVFDTIEPAATALAVSGRIPRDRKALLQLIGSALLAQHRVSGRIAFAEKPEILWEHPELERFYARLEDEFEIVERGTLLNGKMTVLASVAETFTDMMDTARSARLELLIVLLIVAEIVIAAVTMFRPAV
jgi:uncharacterized Rmd1/YagE family protein